MAQSLLGLVVDALIMLAYFVVVDEGLRLASAASHRRRGRRLHQQAVAALRP
jgi:hypothetical protein